jgi:hypothetical protein
MLTEKVLRSSVMEFAASLVLTVLLSSIPARAQSGAGSYAFLIGSGFLCDAGDASACPAVVKSQGGDTFEMSGAGVFNPRQKTVIATGTFTLRSSDGNTRETGIWIASELVSFDPYGVAPGELVREGRALGPTPFGVMRMPMFSGSMPAGGLAVLRIRLLPALGIARSATLQVNCTLGKVPDQHPTEGIRLSFERSGTEFDEEISGRALFLLTFPAASAAEKAPAPEPDTTPWPTEIQQ